MVENVQEKVSHTEKDNPVLYTDGKDVPFKVKTYNKISSDGLKRFDEDRFDVSEDHEDPSAIIVRSFKLHDIEFPKSLISIGRAGAGVNNIPVQKCTDNNVVVFNTPGANANAVKELVLSSLFISSRNILKSVNFVHGLKGKGDDVPSLVEKNKSLF